MPSSVADENDGNVKNGPISTFAGARDASSGTTVTTSGQNSTAAVGTSGGSGRGATITTTIQRSFFEFDFTGVTNVSTATLKLKSTSNNSAIVRIVKAGDFAPLGTGDFDNIVGFSAGNTMAGNVTDFIDAPVTLASNATTDFTLNSTAIADMNSNDKFRIAVVGNTHDYLNVAVSATDTNVGGIVFGDNPGTESDPQIEYTTSTEGRTADAGGTKNKDQLKRRALISTVIDADTDFEIKLTNTLKTPVYFNLEGVGGKNIFSTASFRTTTSDSGSNVLSFISESQHASFILAGESTSSFFLSSSIAIPGNNIEAIAANITQLTPTSTETLGVSMEVLS